MQIPRRAPGLLRHSDPRRKGLVTSVVRSWLGCDGQTSVFGRINDARCCRTYRANDRPHFRRPRTCGSGAARCSRYCSFQDARPLGLRGMRSRNRRRSMAWHESSLNARRTSSTWRSRHESRSMELPLVNYRVETKPPLTFGPGERLSPLTRPRRLGRSLSRSGRNPITNTPWRFHRDPVASCPTHCSGTPAPSWTVPSTRKAAHFRSLKRGRRR